MWNIWWNLGYDFSTCQESTKNFGPNSGANFGKIFGNFVSNFASFFRKLRSAEGRWTSIFVYFLSSLGAQTAKSAQKVGSPPIPERVRKKCWKPHFLRKKCAKSAVRGTFWHSFGNRREPHFLCRLMFLPFGLWGSTGNTQIHLWKPFFGPSRATLWLISGLWVVCLWLMAETFKLHLDNNLPTGPTTNRLKQSGPRARKRLP